MGLTDREIKDLYDGHASRLCDELSLMTKYDNFVNRPLSLEDYHGFVVELEAIKRAREEADRRLEGWMMKQECLWKEECNNVYQTNAG